MREDNLVPVTIDELLFAVNEFQIACHDAIVNRRWGEVVTARAKLRAWIEDNQLPVSFPDGNYFESNQLSVSFPVGNYSRADLESS